MIATEDRGTHRQYHRNYLALRLAHRENQGPGMACPAPRQDPDDDPRQGDCVGGSGGGL
jgi:hypothetical protein